MNPSSLAAWFCAGTVAAAIGLPAHAQNRPVRPAVAVPYYTAEQALQGLYRHHLPLLAQAATDAAEQLQRTGERHCSGQATLSAYRTQWQLALTRWQALASPELGPMVQRRSQRQIDFWPTRPALLQQALQRAPQSLADMERVGTPAKGFPALEALLWGAIPGVLDGPDRLAGPACQYASLVSQGIAAELHALQGELSLRAAQHGAEGANDDAATATAFGEWVNQWLAGFERLRWAQIEKPIQAQRSHARSAIAFPRATREANLADWRAQWAALQRQARLDPAQYADPPRGGDALLPVEALLMGKGRLALAQRWSDALARVDARLATLRPQASTRELLALTATMKAVTVLYQTEVAAALDVPLGFSDADGD